MSDVREERSWKPIRAGAFMEKIGPLRSARVAGNAFVFGLQTDESHANAIGLIHGGVLTSLLDQAFAMTAWEAGDRAPTVTVQMDTRFVSAARPGVFLEANATLREHSGSMMFLDAEVVERGRVVALGTAVMKISQKVG